VNLPFDINSTLRGISKVHLHGGVAGKVSVSLIVACLSITGIAWSVRNIWVTGAALLFIFILVFTMLWRLISFADRHPQAAILDGAEFVLHQQIIQGTKENPKMIIDPRDRTHSDLTQPESSDFKAALQADTITPSPKLTSGKENL
jgi:hypothetical protein